MLKVFTDAATKDQLSGGGIVIIGDGLYQQISIPIPATDNHTAEMAVIIDTLVYLIDHDLHQQSILLYSDSKTAIQLFDKGRTKNPEFQDYLQRFNRLAAKFELLVLQWIPEKQNKGADHLARQGLAKARKIQ